MILNAKRDLLVLLALSAAVFMVASKNMTVDLDLFHEMALARQIDQEGAMPLTDSFAYTPTLPKVVHHEWLTGVFLYWVCVKWGGGAVALATLKYLLAAGVAGGCYWYARRNDVPIYLFAALAPLALLVGGWMAFTNIRAQVFTLLFLVITFHLLDSDRRGGRWWIAVWIPVVILWANFHGGVVSGLGIMGCYGIAKFVESWTRSGSPVTAIKSISYLIVTGIATAAAINVSPYGWDYVPYLIRAIRLPRPLITEWQPIWFLDSQSVILYLISVGIAVAAIGLYWFGNRATNSGFKFSAGLSDGDHLSDNNQLGEPLKVPSRSLAVNLFPRVGGCLDSLPSCKASATWVAVRGYLDLFGPADACGHQLRGNTRGNVEKV